MAAEAQIRDALMSQHMSVGTSVNFMTGWAALYPGSAVFVEVWTALVHMTSQTSFMLESSESFSRGGDVRVMAGGTVHDPFLESVTFVELKLGKHILMANVTTFQGTGSEKGRSGHLCMDHVAGRTIQ